MWMGLFLTLFFQSGVLQKTEVSLCGESDAEVCMTNSTAFVLQCSQLGPGTAFVLKVPGITNETPYVGQGPAQEPYYFAESQGSLTDQFGNVWSQPQSIYTDEAGIRGIVFTLEEGALTGTATLMVNHITICQKVFDGPRRVELTVQLWGAFRSHKKTHMVETKQEGPQFQACSEYEGMLPVLEDDRVFLMNPHGEAMQVQIGGEDFRVESHEQIEVVAGSLEEMSASAEPSIVLWREQGDLDLVGLQLEPQGHWGVPHLPQDRTNWEGLLTLATPWRVQLNPYYQDDSRDAIVLEAGVHQMEFEGQGWARLNANKAFNGVYSFRQKGEPFGSATLLLDRVEGQAIGATRWVIPHLAQDETQFWNGVVLTNYQATPLEVEAVGFREDGTQLGTQKVHVGEYEKVVGLVPDIFGFEETPSWIELIGDSRFSGIVLYGSEQGLAGYHLAEQASTNVSFPALKSDEVFWSGLVLLNSDSKAANGTLWLYHDLQTKTGQAVQLNPKEKLKILVPEGTRYAIWEGDPVFGLAVIGDHQQKKLASYNGYSIKKTRKQQK